jgi:hypothetical protein
MDEVSYWVYLDPNMTHEEFLQLLNEVSDVGHGVVAEAAGAGPGLNEFVMVSTILANTAATALAVAAFAERIRQFQQKRRMQGKTSRLRITRATRETVDLTAATGEDIRKFIRGDASDTE